MKCYERKSEKAQGREFMKRRMLFLSFLMILLSIITFGANAQDKYVPKPNEELYGTWTSKQNVEDFFHPQKIVNTADGYKNYAKISNSVPFEEGTEQIDSKWTDTEGNIWYKTFSTVTIGVYKGYRFQSLVKISKSGTISESVSISIAHQDFKPAYYPTKIDPNDSTYKIMFRAEE
jgi:hypothetical protein